MVCCRLLTGSSPVLPIVKWALYGMVRRIKGADTGIRVILGQEYSVGYFNLLFSLPTMLLLVNFLHSSSFSSSGTRNRLVKWLTYGQARFRTHAMEVGN